MQPLASRICDAAVAAFALWTLLTNLAVLLGEGLDTLIALAAALGCVALAGYAWRRRARRAPAAAVAVDVQGTSPVEPEPALRPLLGISLVAAAVAALLLRAGSGSLTLYWLVALLVSGAFLLSQLPREPRLERAASSRARELALLALCLVCALATAAAHREDADDAFYLNLVVAAVDYPDAPLLAHDTLHGHVGVAMSLPVFRVLSYEMLEAAIARLSGISALSLVHVLMPPLVALLLPLAYARLLRLLLPGRWLAAVAIVVAQLLLVGDGAAGHGDFAILRLQQGKSILLHLALPLIAAYGLELALAPSRARWLRLAAAQIAAVGLSSSGLWLAPVAAGLALTAGLPAVRDAASLRRAAARLALGLGTAIHPIVLGLSLRSETGLAFREALHPLESLSWSGERLVAHALELVFGNGPFATLALFSLLAVFAAASTTLLRRYAALSVFALLLLFWNPYVAHFVAVNVAGADTYFRVFWLLPVPVLIAAVLTAPLELPALGRSTRSPLGTGALLLTAVALLAAVADVPTLGERNQVRLGPPGDKLPPFEREASAAIVALTHEGELVLAPLRVARWLPLYHRHPSPLVVREMYLDVLHAQLGGEELDRRTRLAHLVGGKLRLANGGTLLAQAIADYPLSVVCLGDAALAWPELRQALANSPLEVRHRDPHFEVWARRER